MRRIDSHQHFWRLARGDYGWLTPERAAIHRDFGPDDLRPLLAAAGIAETVIVQAAPTEAETRFLLEIARASGFVAGVVGWTDFAAADAPDRLARLAADPKLRGARPMIHDISDDGWMLRPELAPAFRAVVALDLRFDALLRPRHLRPLLALLGRHPDLKAVIDHGAKPEIAARRFEPWASDIAAVARETGALCKLSGLVTEAAPDWTVDDLRRYVDHLIACFGPARLIWGSDWPVVNLAGGYARWWAATAACLAGLAAAERDAILGLNAARFYGV